MFFDNFLNFVYQSAKLICKLKLSLQICFAENKGKDTDSSICLTALERTTDFLAASKKMKKVFSFDAETNGLWGQAFAIGALVYDENGAEIARFVGRLPDTEVTDSWVKDNVLPNIQNIEVCHQTYDALLADFAKFYLAYKQDADVVVHMGFIVETKILRDLYDRGLIGEWDAPYPLYDVSGNLQAAGEDPTSVDSYVQKHELSVGKFEGGTHNPLYDSAVAAVVYRHLRGW